MKSCYQVHRGELCTAGAAWNNHTRTTGQLNKAFWTSKTKTQGSQNDRTQKKYPGLAESPHTKTEIFMQLWALLQKVVLIKTKAIGQTSTALKIDALEGKNLTGPDW